MMKKTIYLLTMIFAVALLSTSCEKEDPVVPESYEFSVDELVGNWNFESLSFVDVDHNTTVDGEYNTDQELSDLNEFYDFVQLDFSFTATSVTLSSTYLDENVNGTGDWSNSYTYTIEGNIISINDGYLMFEVMNGESLLNDEGELKLKLNDGNADMPEGGIYTLIK